VQWKTREELERGEEKVLTATLELEGCVLGDSDDMPGVNSEELDKVPDGKE
jgi:hypothetical protein